MSTPAAVDTGDIAPLLVVALVTRLRAGGVPVSTSEALDAIQGLVHMDLRTRSQVRGTLRATMIKDATHEVLFRRSFDTVFPRARRESPDAPASSSQGEVSSDEHGAPTVTLSGGALRLAREHGISRVDVSLAHQGGMVVCFALAS